MRSRSHLIVAILCSLAFFAYLFLRYGYEETWQLWNIPTMTPHFADLRIVTGLSVTIAQGYDPMLHNPGDPWQRPFNYPPIWKILPLIGIKPEHTTLIGLLFIGLFLIGLCLPFSELSWAETGLLMAGVLSPAVLLGIERANADLLIFFLIAFAIWVIEKSALWTAIVIQTAVLLKLFPIFCISVLLRVKKRTFLLLTALILGISGLYFSANFREMSLIFSATQKSYNLSYGINVLPQRLERSPFANYAPASLTLTSLTAAILTIVGAWFGSRFDLSHSCRKASFLDAFRAGSAIYVGTFFLGNNFDYRLMFLLLTIPQLTHWWQAKPASIQRTAQITGIALYLSLWHRLVLRGLKWLLPAELPGSINRALAFFPDEIANWILFAGMIVLLAASFPRWVFLKNEEQTF
ncbi:MAG: hypothetical protein N3D16_03510 [Anaerolineales bacterium]|nr:hypothetical protein [Anaerolineales bacterium]